MSYTDTLKQELSGTKAYEQTSEKDKSVINNHIFYNATNIHPSELQLNKANFSDTEVSFLDLHLFLSDGFVKTESFDKRDDFVFDIVTFPFLDGDAPRSTSYCVYFLNLIVLRGWSGGAMVLGKLPVPGRPTILITVGQGPIALAVGAGGVVWTFLLSSVLSLASPSLWETARCRLKYCLKGPLNPKQPTNQIFVLLECPVMSMTLILVITF